LPFGESVSGRLSDGYFLFTGVVIMKRLVYSLIAVAGMGAGVANAALDSGVTTAITNAGSDGATLGGLVLAVIVGIGAFKWLRRAL
jgi:hypothetical protein